MIHYFSADIDLSDESGNIKFLRETPFRNASEVLGDRECLILLRVDSKFPFFVTGILINRHFWILYETDIMN